MHDPFVISIDQCECCINIDWMVVIDDDLIGTVRRIVALTMIDVDAISM